MRITFKKMCEQHPEFEFERTNDHGHISVTHKETGKKVVCIIGHRVMDYNSFVEQVKENPEMLNQSSYFRHTEPTSKNPYEYEGKSVKVKVIATEQDLNGWFGKDHGFCKHGDELIVDYARWSSSQEEWQPTFNGFWLMPSMVKIIS